MDRLVIVIAAGMLFLVRDARLLAVTGWRTRAAWTAVHLMLATAAAAYAPSVSKADVSALLASPLVIWIVIGAHALHAAATLLWRRAAVGVIPAPLFVLSLGLVSWSLTGRVDAPAALVAGIAWTPALAALGAATLIRPRVQQSVAFPTAINILALILLPIDISGPGGSAPPVDWTAQAIPLLVTAALIAASYGWHRLRSPRTH